VTRTQKVLFSVSVLLLFFFCSSCSRGKIFSCEMEVYYLYVGGGFLPYPYECDVLQRVDVVEKDTSMIRREVFLVFQSEGNRLCFNRISLEEPTNSDVYAKGSVIGWVENKSLAPAYPFQMLVAYDFSPITIWSVDLYERIHHESDQIKMVQTTVFVTGRKINHVDILGVRSVVGKPIIHK
jgi:hypothetical protein